jgi:hypothetical protein
MIYLIFLLLLDILNLIRNNFFDNNKEENDRFMISVGFRQFRECQKFGGNQLELQRADVFNGNFFIFHIFLQIINLMNFI